MRKKEGIGLIRQKSPSSRARTIKEAFDATEQRFACGESELQEPRFGLGTTALDSCETDWRWKSLFTNTLVEQPLSLEVAQVNRPAATI